MDNIRFQRIVDGMDIKKEVKTAVIEARTDIRILFTLDEFFIQQGVVVQTRSELVRSALELLCNYLTTQRKAPHYTTRAFHEARNGLLRFGSMNRGGQNQATLTAAMAREELEDNMRPIQAGPSYQPMQPQIQQPMSMEEVQRIKEETRRRYEEHLKMDPLYVPQDPREEVPDEASLLIKPAIVVED